MELKKICIVMAYYDRQYQLDKTLQSFSESKHDNFSVIIVDDHSPQEIVLPELTFDVTILKTPPHKWTNCCHVYNRGFVYAQSMEHDIIVIQSPECYHVGDVLMHINDNVKDDNYIAYGCFQIDKDTTFSEHDIISLSETNLFRVTANNGGLGQNAWWNHTVYQPLPQYWCTALTADNMRSINGIDERFATGYAVEDGYFLWQVEKLGLDIQIVDYPFVVHQWHDRLLPEGVPELVKKNQRLYDNLIKQDTYRSHHCITPDL